MRFLALGDSYTIGEGVPAGDRWPAQIAAMLRAEGLAIDDPVIIARTGWTTAELDAAITLADPPGTFDLVSLLAGVNDQYRGGPLEEYQTQFGALLAGAVALAGGMAHRVLVVSIPDWGVTPFASGRDRKAIGQGIDAFSATARDAAATAGTAWVDVTGVSRSRAYRAALSADGLHPSADQYRAWAKLLLPHATRALGR
ncbi:MAG: GDSL-type esterase/lipase family protein [Dehalococcoidia bacterium]